MNYQPYQPGIGAFVRSVPVQAAITATAGEFAQAARSQAPVKTGAYRDSFTVAPALTYVPTRRDPGWRAGARVTNTASHAQALDAQLERHRRRDSLSALVRRANRQRSRF